MTPKKPALAPPSDLNPRHDPALDFPDREFGELTRDDYAALGFMSGLEVHQQLLTRRKLFCRCPAGRYVDRYDAEVLRHMRPTLSELGEYDGTALMEFKTRKEIIYRLDRSTVCTYEIDDTPPFEIDPEAVESAIELARLFGLNLVSELHVMRKQYLDGSIPTGFQRTAMVGLTGTIPFVEPDLGVDRELRIRQLSLEEDSCREVADVGHRIIFKTDRLGMPLTEAVTEPELMTPDEVRGAGRLLAAVARATGKVRRGPGAARQDVNVSVAGGRRVEIKGVYHHKRLPQLVHIEAYRQLNLLRVREALRARNVRHEDLVVPGDDAPWDASDLVADVTRLKAVRHARLLSTAHERDDTIVAVRLPGFGGLLSHRTQPGLDFSHELAERVRVIGCPTAPLFLLHSDSPIADVRWDELRNAVGARAPDAVVLLWMPRDDAATSAREVLLRAQDALVGVPAETRQAHANGTTGFERILPGADRMYPDTDTPPLPIADATIERITARLPELPWNREARYQAMGLSHTEARWVARAPWRDLFDAATATAGPLTRRVAHALGKRWGSHGGRDVVAGTQGEQMAAAVRAVRDGEVRVEALDRLVDDVLSGMSAAAAVARYVGDPVPDAHTVVRHAAEKAQSLDGRSPETQLRFAMGEAMRQLLGRADPKHVRTELRAMLHAVPETAK